jgi:hypothetical protein
MHRIWSGFQQFTVTAENIADVTDTVKISRFIRYEPDHLSVMDDVDELTSEKLAG